MACSKLGDQSRLVKFQPWYGKYTPNVGGFGPHYVGYRPHYAWYKRHIVDYVHNFNYDECKPNCGGFRPEYVGYTPNHAVCNIRYGGNVFSRYPINMDTNPTRYMFVKQKKSKADNF